MQYLTEEIENRCKTLDKLQMQYEEKFEVDHIPLDRNSLLMSAFKTHQSREENDDIDDQNGYEIENAAELQLISD